MRFNFDNPTKDKSGRLIIGRETKTLRTEPDFRVSYFISNTSISGRIILFLSYVEDTGKINDTRKVMYYYIDLDPEEFRDGKYNRYQAKKYIESNNKILGANNSVSKDELKIPEWEMKEGSDVLFNDIQTDSINNIGQKIKKRGFSNIAFDGKDMRKLLSFMNKDNSLLEGITKDLNKRIGRGGFLSMFKF